MTQVVFSRTPVFCAAGLGLSAPRLLWSCGPVGWSLFPLNFLSPGVVCRPSLWLVLWARRNCGCVGWPFFPLHSQSSVVMDRAFVFPFRFGVVEVSSCRAPTICPRSAHPCPSLPDLPSASTRPPAESRTFSLRRVSQRLVLTHHFIQARRLRCRSVHVTDAPLNQLVGLSHENSLARCERSGAQLPRAAHRFSLTPWDSLVPRVELLLQPVVVVTLGFEHVTSLSPRSPAHLLPKAAPLPSRVCPPVVPRPRASGGSVDAPSRTRAHKRESLGAKDSLPHSTGGNVAATRVLPIAKASTPLASPPVSQAAGRDKRRRKARKSL